MAKKNRTEIPAEIAAKVLFDSDRTCCICGIRGKPVQIHHIDEDPSNSIPENLAVLCFDCHHQTQIRGGFDRKLDSAQVALYKSDWVQRVASTRDKEHGVLSLQVSTGVKNVKFAQLKESGEEHLYSFEAEYPQIDSGDPHADDETNQCIDNFVVRILQRFRAEAIEGTAEKAEAQKNVGFMAWDSFSISHNIALFTTNILSIEFILWSYYHLAAHPNTNTRTLNFLLAPSLQLELRDVFKPASNYLEVLSAYCVDDLHKQQSSRWADPEKQAQDLKATGDSWILSGAGPQYQNFERFVFANGGIRVSFDAYSVGSYAEGRYEVFVPIDVIRPVLNESIVTAWLK